MTRTVRDLLETFGFYTDDPGDLEDFVKALFKVCMLIFIVLTWLVMGFAILKAGNGSLPPEPQWWLEFEKMIGVTW